MADVESSMLYFCSEVAKHQKVAITGECADEIFGGYPWFHRKEMMERHGFPWSHDMNARTCLLKEDFCKETHINEYAASVYEQSVAETPCLPGESGEEKRRREISWLNIRWFMMTLLNRMDRTSMYSGLEARVPYADHRILEYVYNIPWDMKCRGGQTKSLLIAAGQGLLPDEILHRKKSPYPKTYDPNYENLLKSRLTEILQEPNEPIHRILDTNKTIAFMNTPADYGRPWYGQLMAGPQMIAYLLQINYWMKQYHL
jgi:asparagine synthase (glutamine-hydrolysing)